MKCKYDKIGIMGGSFDPIHNGHLVLAEQVRTRFQLDKIIFIPAGNPPHKEAFVKKEHRFNMTTMAIEDNEYFEVSRLEMDKSETTYTIDTIRELKDEYGDETEIFFITGADAVIELSKWKDFEELLSICKFIGATRPGIDEDYMREQIDYLVSEYRADITITQVPALAISSTDIRRRVKYNLSIKYLLPNKTEKYIYDNELYSDERVIL